MKIKFQLYDVVDGKLLSEGEGINVIENISCDEPIEVTRMGWPGLTEPSLTREFRPGRMSHQIRFDVINYIPRRKNED